MTDEAMSPLRRRMIEDMTIRCATPVLPIAIGRPSSPHLRPLPKQAVNAPQQHTVGIEIPIASDAPLCPTSRGFLPWRLSDAGRRPPNMPRRPSSGRHPKLFTLPDSCTAAECRHSITLWALESYSGNPAFRRPSMNSFALASPPQAINGDIVKAGSSSSTRIAASRASASRPRWAKADARQR